MVLSFHDTLDFQISTALGMVWFGLFWFVTIRVPLITGWRFDNNDYYALSFSLLQFSHFSYQQDRFSPPSSTSSKHSYARKRSIP
ncbi:hypothetical protein EJ08DRAFT_528204 [Tothia fuscella]|uniref:Uncharacterized protein n=1 Tax=Tothia fuscella TaxID=1048955 RepID=A0A9P4NGR3_9PEZI|nr:hypothetical protein EJ08DRAFT_528204 [Tothia fuscella]